MAAELTHHGPVEWGDTVTVATVTGRLWLWSTTTYGCRAVYPGLPDPPRRSRPRCGRYRETMTDEPWPNRPWFAVIPTRAPST